MIFFVSKNIKKQEKRFSRRGPYKNLKNPKIFLFIRSFVKWPMKRIHFIWSFVDKWPNGKGDFRSFWRAVSPRKNSGWCWVGKNRGYKFILCFIIVGMCGASKSCKIGREWDEIRIKKHTPQNGCIATSYTPILWMYTCGCRQCLRPRPLGFLQ